MYMAKCVLKNKKLVRNLIILAVLLFIGFFVWRAFFSGSGIKEGFKWNDEQELGMLQVCRDANKDKDADSFEFLDAVGDCVSKMHVNILQKPIEICGKKVGKPTDAPHGTIPVVCENAPYQGCLQAQYECINSGKEECDDVTYKKIYNDTTDWESPECPKPARLT